MHTLLTVFVETCIIYQQFLPIAHRELSERLSYLPLQLWASIKGKAMSACQMPVSPHYSEREDREVKPKWVVPK